MSSSCRLHASLETAGLGTALAHVGDNMQFSRSSAVMYSSLKALFTLNTSKRVSCVISKTYLSLIWSFLVMPMIPICMLRVLFIHSVAWSAGTWLNHLSVLFTTNIPCIKSA